MSNITFSQMLTSAIKPLNDIKEANHKKEHYDFMGYEFKDDDKLSVQYSTKKDKADFDDALNFAKEQINNIENSMKTDKYDGPYKHDEKLNLIEIKNSNSDAFLTYDGEDLLEKLDLDGDCKTLSAQEYATYIYTLDKINGVDGELNMEEITSLENFDEDIKETAQKIYDENNPKEEKKSFWEKLGNRLERLCNS